MNKLELTEIKDRLAQINAIVSDGKNISIESIEALIEGLEAAEYPTLFSVFDNIKACLESGNPEDITSLLKTAENLVELNILKNLFDSNNVSKEHLEQLQAFMDKENGKIEWASAPKFNERAQMVVDGVEALLKNPNDQKNFSIVKDALLVVRGQESAKLAVSNFLVKMKMRLNKEAIVVKPNENDEYSLLKLTGNETPGLKTTKTLFNFAVQVNNTISAIMHAETLGKFIGQVVSGHIIGPFKHILDALDKEGTWTPEVVDDATLVLSKEYLDLLQQLRFHVGTLPLQEKAPGFVYNKIAKELKLCDLNPLYNEKNLTKNSMIDNLEHRIHAFENGSAEEKQLEDEIKLLTVLKNKLPIYKASFDQHNVKAITRLKKKTESHFIKTCPDLEDKIKQCRDNMIVTIGPLAKNHGQRVADREQAWLDFGAMIDTQISARKNALEELRTPAEVEKLGLLLRFFMWIKEHIIDPIVRSFTSKSKHANVEKSQEEPKLESSSQVATGEALSEAGKPKSSKSKWVAPWKRGRSGETSLSDNPHAVTSQFDQMNNAQREVVIGAPFNVQ